ncbi:CidA/LrgA family holin-like protein [Paenibacillus sp. MWE-103]|uniref:CidA/LrgA family holin-like protein n=1 Tax=Paenibacillus artemisiicola TaxID=1172618 RepID=A0ABS3WD00_9BACL|nr:CidA/LrgA family holin-like protein [Paenibacillus artemisiicola]MBO7746159.1 CidA/LrgA family holin-like protein [Paenibacillus artemisiicola]
MRKSISILFQVLFFTALARLMNELVAWLRIPVPGSILGMLLVFALIRLRVLPRRRLEGGADWLIATMLLFFIPPAVGIIAYRQLLADDGIRIALVLAAGTAVVMLCSGLIAQSIAKRKESSQP